MLDKIVLNSKVANNLSHVKLWLLIPPLFLLFILSLYFIFFSKDSNCINFYTQSQKEPFLYLNDKLSYFPTLQYNLTQLGDALIFFSLLTVFIIYAPKLWEVILTSGIISLVVSAVLKKIFNVPRPAAIFDNDSFVIVGKILAGRTSLPSGHSIVTFNVLTILLFAFIPQKKINKIMWSAFVLILGFVIAFSRVGVGAHYPLDVLIGSTIGFIVAIISIIINNNRNWLVFIENKKSYPFYLVVLLIWAGVIAFKIMSDNLLIFYLSLISLILTMYITISSYVKK